MTQSQEHSQVSLEAVRLGYEPQRLSVRASIIFLVSFAVCMLGIFAFCGWLIDNDEWREERTDYARSILKVQQTPPPPELQPSIGHDKLPYEDLDDFRHQEDEMFGKLGWTVNAATHRVIIPAAIAHNVAESERARATAPYVPPTTTGKDYNSIVPGAIPPYDIEPGIKGGQRP